VTLRFNKAQRAKLHQNWQAMETARETGAAFDPTPVVKVFTPDAGATWLIAAASPDGRLAFGVADLGLGFVEVGDLDLQELATVRGKLGLPVEIDRWFRADKSLWSYQRQGDAAGRLSA
jgi:hypothetical protein